jgi:hypothetical protein
VLFARYRTATDYAAADQSELEKVIAPTGYFRAEAKTLILLGQALSDRFGGKVPDTPEELVTLPGVGRKTANLVLGGAPGDLARPPGLSLPQARLRRMRSGPLVPVVRHGPDRRGDRPQARQDRSLFVTGPGCWCAL